MANDDWSLSVGISRYPTWGSQGTLEGTKGDAERFHAWATDPNGGGVDPSRATLLVWEPARTEPFPNRYAIERYFDALLEKRAENGNNPLGRRLYVFMAGHGGALPRDASLEQVLLTAEAKPATPYHFSPRLWCRTVLDDGTFSEVLLLLDCCSNPLTPMPVTPPTRRAAVPRGPTKWGLMISSQLGRESFERTQNGVTSGVFTDALLEGLKEGASAGALSFPALCRRVIRKLPKQVPLTEVTPVEPTLMILGDEAALELAEVESTGSAHHKVRYHARGPVQIRATSRSGKTLEAWSSLEVPSDFDLAVLTTHLGTDARAHAKAPAGASEHALEHPLDGPAFQATPASGELTIEGRTTPGTQQPLRWLELEPWGEPSPVALITQVNHAGTFSARTPIGSHALRLTATNGGDRVSLCLQAPPGGGLRIWLDHPDRDPVLALSNAHVELAVAGAPAASVSTVRLREMLRRHAFDGTRLPKEVLDVCASDLADDPAGLLLVASLAELAGHKALLAKATSDLRQLLGPQDPDVLALEHAVPAPDSTPRLVISWHAQLTTLPAPPPRGHRAALGPWLVLRSGPPALHAAALADALWPGWARDPPSTPPAGPASEDQVVRATDMSPSEVTTIRVKRPPIARLLKSAQVVFIGATNDQLPATLAAAFRLRGSARFERLVLYFLHDEPLAKLRSRDRTGGELLLIRDRTERHLGQLLPLMCERFELRRYNEPKIFASLWDLERADGFIHLSPDLWGADLGTTPSFDYERPGNEGMFLAMQRAAAALERESDLVTHWPSAAGSAGLP